MIYFADSTLPGVALGVITVLRIFALCPSTPKLGIIPGTGNAATGKTIAYQQRKAVHRDDHIPSFRLDI